MKVNYFEAEQSCLKMVLILPVPPRSDCANVKMNECDHTGVQMILKLRVSLRNDYAKMNCCE